MDKDLLKKKLKKYSSEQLNKKMVSSQTSKFEKDLCKEIILERANFIVGSKKELQKETKAEVKEEVKEEFLSEPVVEVKSEKVQEVNDKINVEPSIGLLNKGTKVSFVSSKRSKGSGKELVGFVVRDFYDKQDRAHYYLIKVGVDKYCKRIDSVTEVK